MPRVSSFYGIVIALYYDDHRPPHFHAIYGEFEAVVSIENLQILAGKLPRHAKALVLEWGLRYRQELRENWERAQRHEPLGSIDPLD
jgi:hypothetical protein